MNNRGDTDERTEDSARASQQGTRKQPASSEESSRTAKPRSRARRWAVNALFPGGRGAARYSQRQFDNARDGISDLKDLLRDTMEAARGGAEDADEGDDGMDYSVHGIRPEYRIAWLRNAVIAYWLYLFFSLIGGALALSGVMLFVTGQVITPLAANLAIAGAFGSAIGLLMVIHTAAGVWMLAGHAKGRPRVVATKPSAWFPWKCAAFRHVTFHIIWPLMIAMAIGAGVIAINLAIQNFASHWLLRLGVPVAVTLGVIAWTIRRVQAYDAANIARLYEAQRSREKRRGAPGDEKARIQARTDKQSGESDV